MILARDYEIKEHHSIYLATNGDTIKQRLEGVIYTRQDYYDDGSLKAKYNVRVHGEFRRDTTLNEEKTKLKVITTEGLRDYPFGLVEEYHSVYKIPQTKARIKKRAKIKDGKIDGKLMYYPRMEEILIIAEYNENGEIEGQYNEFYLSSGNISRSKCKGQYGYVVREKKLFNPDTYSYEKQSISEIQKVGQWEYYSSNGDLVSRQNFEWSNFNKNTKLEIDFHNTTWMFNPDVNSFYNEEPYQFVKFAANNKVVYLNCQGDSIGSSNYVIQENERSLRLKDDQIFHRVSIDSENQISLVIVGADITINDEPTRKGEIKMKYTKLNPTNIAISNSDLESIMADSEWIILASIPNRKDSTESMTISKWNCEDSNSDVEMNNNIKKNYTQHLLKVKDSIVFISKRGKNINAKLAITAISNSALVVTNHHENNEVYVFERKR